MQWSRVKTILIVIFIIVNIYLLINYFHSSQNGVTVSPAVVDDAVSILSSNSIQIDKRVIPTTSPQVRVFDVANLYGSNESIAEVFLGEGYFKNDQSVYNLENKSLWINNGNFDFVFDQKDAMPIPKLKGLEEDACKKYAEDLLKEYKLNGSYVKCSSSILENNIRILSYQIVFDDRMVTDSSLRIHISEMGVVKMEGRNWLGDTIYEGSYITTRTAVEALVNFAKNPKIDKSTPIEIIGVEERYYFGARAPESKTISAIPVWCIITKHHGVFLYDARNINLIE